MRRAVLAVRQATTVALVASWAGAVLVGLQGPGGVYIPAGVPEDRGGLTLPALDTTRHPGCVPADQFQGIPATYVVVDASRDEKVLATGRAWALNTDDNRANDVWILGACHE